MNRVVLLVLAVLAVLALSAPANAGLIDAFNGTQPGQAPAALAGIMANGIGLARSLFNIIVGASLVAAIVSAAIKTRSMEGWATGFGSIWMWLVPVILGFNATVGLLPNIGAFFLGIGSVLTGRAPGAGYVTPYAILGEASAVGLAMIRMAGAVAKSGILGPNIPFLPTPAAMFTGMAYGTALLVTLCFAALAVLLVKKIWALFVFASVGCFKVALLGANITQSQGWGFIFGIVDMGAELIVVIVMVTVVANEANTWPAFIAHANLSNFLSTMLQVNGAALFCAMITYGVASEVGLAFLKNLALSFIPRGR